MNKIVYVVVLASFFATGCAFVEMSGKMTRATGEIMTNYSQNHTGFIAKGAGFGGRINTAVGTAVENVAKRGARDENGSVSEQFIDANKQVMTAAIGAVKNDASAVKCVQGKLQSLGYDVVAVDGVMGPKTKAALGSYQEKNGLKPTQTLDAPTLESFEDCH